MTPAAKRKKMQFAWRLHNNGVSKRREVIAEFLRHVKAQTGSGERKVKMKLRNAYFFFLCRENRKCEVEKFFSVSGGESLGYAPHSRNLKGHRFTTKSVKVDRSYQLRILVVQFRQLGLFDKLNGIPTCYRANESDGNKNQGQSCRSDAFCYIHLGALFLVRQRRANASVLRKKRRGSN